MSVKINDRVFGANVSPKIIQEFKKLSGGVTQDNPLEPIESTFEGYLGDKIPFARMWTAVVTSGSGVQYEDQETFYYSINDNKSDNIDYEPNQPISQTNVFNELSGDKNSLLKPKAGIKSISSRTQGSLGAIKRTSIDFVVHNKKDFDEIFLPFFLRPGCTLIVDYGWSDKSFKLYDIQEQLRNTDTEMTTFKNFIYGGVFEGPNGEEISTNSNGTRYYIQSRNGEEVIVDDDKMPEKPGFIEQNKGKVDTLIGVVTSYNSKINEQGSFECNVEIVSENTSLIDFDISEDNKLKFVFANKIEEILVGIISGNPKLAASSELQAYDNFKSSEKVKILNEFIAQVQRKTPVGPGPKTEKTLGIIPQTSMKLGVYYEGVTDVGNTPRPEKDVLYISWGLFEDVFLNSFIAENIEKNKFDINFKNQNSFVRFNQTLYNRQVAEFYSSDVLPLFVYPEDWSDSRDGKNDDFKNQKNGNNIYKTPVIPLRDLFISVKLLSTAFSKKQNVNDVIEFILDEINRDSFDIFKLKMYSPNASNSSMAIQDVNLLPPLVDKKEDLLTFDVTSELSIVNGLDYSFATPKGGLQNMIAISNTSQDKIFNVAKSDNLNFLNLLKSDKYANKKGVFLRSLPLNKRTSEHKDTTVKFDFNSPSVIEYRNTFDDNINTNITVAIKEFEDAQGDLKEKLVKAGGKPVVKQQNNQEGTDTKDEETGKNIIWVNSQRDKFGKLANLTTILSNEDDSISTIMPINLSLSIYGNNFLNVGDIFTINFLPNSYRDKVYFQITNVEQKIDTNWQTTYSTIMRVRPKSKKEIVDTTKYETRDSNSMLRQQLKPYGDNAKNLQDAIYSSKPIRRWNNLFDIFECEFDYSKISRAENWETDKRVLINAYPPVRSLTEAMILYALTETFVTVEGWNIYQDKMKNQGLRKYGSTEKISGKSKLLDSRTFWDKKQYAFLYGYVFEKKFEGKYGSDNSGLLRDMFFSKLNNRETADEIMVGGQGYEQYEAWSFFLMSLQKVTKEKETYIPPGGLAYQLHDRPIFQTIYERLVGNQITKEGDYFYDVSNTPSQDALKMTLDPNFAPVGREFYFKVGNYGRREKQTVYILTPILPTDSRKYLQDIKIPKWFLGNNSIDDFCDLFIKNYYSLLGKEIPLQNPGYPFTRENFDIGAPNGPPGPFGEYDSASQARAALAKQYGYSNYNDYKKNYRGTGDRKFHWDSNPQIWKPL
jgi:hypothetical protein